MSLTQEQKDEIDKAIDLAVQMGLVLVVYNPNRPDDPLYKLSEKGEKWLKDKQEEILRNS